MPTYSQPEIRQLLSTVPHWYHRIVINDEITTPGINDGAQTLKRLQLPMDCRGKRVLDLGTRDGYFAFEMERRGAEVVAVDYVPPDKTGFAVVSRILGSKVTHLHANIYNLSPQTLGTFDIVLFLGLLYHLPDLVRALNVVRSLCHDRMYLETQSIDNALLLPDGSTVPLASVAPVLADMPLVQFYPGRTLNNDPTNYWAPNLKALTAMLTECRFSVLRQSLHQDRAIVECQTAENEELAYFNAISSSTTRAG